jgi:uncharacterized protein (DUF433 family)
MPYPSHVAAALSGASLGQLAYWRKPRADDVLLAPDFREGTRPAYSFRDVVALRTFVYLRGELSLQRIRKAVAKLRELGNMDHLSSYRLYVWGESVVWAESDDKLVDLVSHPGQYVMKAVMADVLDSFTTQKGVEVLPLLRPRKEVAVDPDVRGGYPVIAGTRIPFDVVAGLVADGVPLNEVHELYPTVGAEAARDAFEFAEYVASFRRPRAAAG